MKDRTLTVFQNTLNDGYLLRTSLNIMLCVNNNLTGLVEIA